ncbi:MAG TPA: TAT-variant-translocated molybdopterin oxidoreductase [Candidatus Nanopelagicales bacterium]|nr:TAT-variant-translocated molybdopterin oxidoreductase [Candidatus Nanopelagicales bacterium]
MKRVPLPIANDTSGKSWWRSLGELENDPGFHEQLPAEFPPDPHLPPEGESRRKFLSIMGASMALAGLTGCRRPNEKILPYTRAPEEVVPGNPLHFASAFPFLGTAFGVLVESHEGRPTKIEGNPRHPESLGSTTLWGQGWILDMYDPDRSGSPLQKGQTKEWAEASDFLRAEGERLKAKQGKGLTILTEAHRSPSVAAQIKAIKEAMPEARVVRYEPLSRDNIREGARLAFGRPLETTLDLEKAKTIVALDADLLTSEGSPIKQARGFVAGRNVDQDKSKDPNRLYAIESHFSLTGTTADHRLRIQSRLVPAFAFALAAELAKQHGVALGADVAAAAEAKAEGLSDKAKKYVAAIAKELAANRGRGVVVAGRGQPAEVHAVVHLVNKALDNTGADKPVRFVAAFDEGRDGAGALVELAQAIGKNEVETLLILGGNPVYDAPADARFAEALAKVPTSIHLSTHVDETSEKVTWHLPRTHPLESWSDVRAEDGTASIIQPLIAPLFNGKSDAEVLELFRGGNRSDYDIVRATWRGDKAEAEFDKAWRRALHEGVFADSASVPEAPEATADAAAAAIKAFAGAAKEGLEITFRPDVHTWDGRFANNGWLQELPDPMTKMTWGNGAEISPTTATKLGVKDGDMLSVSGPGGSITLPVIVAPGQADDSIALTVGQGRRAALRVARGVGVDTGVLRTSAAFDVAGGFAAQRTGAVTTVARTQEHFAMEGRPIALEGSIDEYRKDPEFARKKGVQMPLFSLFKEPDRSQGHAWGMAIDLNACVGCNACVTACQAENNIPVVGPEGVARSREMHWIRIDRYYEGPADEPESISQPMLCQHCENAPCEQVCPAAATVHSPEGLNDMAYNRCVGTRYCANNCPFKVRRFNYFNYTKDTPEHRQMQFNPEVTVRHRGVMEKCSFCVQRINRAKIEAKRDGKTRVDDGVIKTACEAACPTQAITFGDLNNPTSAVSAKVSGPRGYRLLEDLNVKPRITYLARIRNKNPELAGA